MSVNEISALAQKFADAFDRRDIKTVLDMLSDDVEVFDTFPIGSTARLSSPSTSMRPSSLSPRQASAFGSRLPRLQR